MTVLQLGVGCYAVWEWEYDLLVGLVAQGNCYCCHPSVATDRRAEEATLGKARERT